MIIESFISPFCFPFAISFRSFFFFGKKNVIPHNVKSLSTLPLSLPPFPPFLHQPLHQQFGFFPPENTNPPLGPQPPNSPSKTTSPSYTNTTGSATSERVSWASLPRTAVCGYGIFGMSLESRRGIKLRRSRGLRERGREGGAKGEVDENDTIHIWEVYTGLFHSSDG